MNIEHAFQMKNDSKKRKLMKVHLECLILKRKIETILLKIKEIFNLTLMIS